MAVALIVIVLTHPHISHLQTHTPPLSLLALRSYQHSVPIKSCALNLIKPLIYIKQLISPSTLVCVSQGTLLPREGDLAAPTQSPQSFFFVIPPICFSKTPNHLLFFFSPPLPPAPLCSCCSCCLIFYSPGASTVL